MNKFDKKKISNFFFSKIKNKNLKIDWNVCTIFFSQIERKKKFRCTFLGCIEIFKSTISQKLKIDFLFVSKHNAAFSHLRTCRAPLPLPLLRSGGNFMKDADCADCIYVDTLEFLSVSPTKRNVLKWPNLQERWTMGWNEWKINFTIFCDF